MLAKIPFSLKIASAVVRTSKFVHNGCGQQMCNLNATCCGHQTFRESAKTTILSEYLKLEKSGFNFMKTRFDWERLAFANYRIVSLWNQVFGFFFAKVNKDGYSVQNFGKRFKTRFTTYSVLFSGSASGRNFARFLSSVDLIFRRKFTTFIWRSIRETGSNEHLL